VDSVWRRRHCPDALGGNKKKKKKRAKASEASTEGIQQPGIGSAPKQGETPTETLKRPRLEGGQSTKKAQGLTGRLWPTLR
jgi:hypothetical protein